MPTSGDSPPRKGESLRRATEALVRTLNDRRVQYAIIGGVAVVQHSIVRTTEDVDALVAVPQLALPGLLEALRGNGFRVDLHRNIREFVDDGCTSLKFEETDVDLMRPMLPMHVHVLGRAQPARILDLDSHVLSAEGLIVMKLAAFRPRDQQDIQDLIEAYRGELDFEFIRAEMAAFTEVGETRQTQFEAWVKEAAGERGP
ncbi:MAG: nucleotidyltransferase [Phycisphaerales bacterium]|nr:nucleotidyltransferase [Phycisphaerales bacterium]